MCVCVCVVCILYDFFFGSARSLQTNCLEDMSGQHGPVCSSAVLSAIVHMQDEFLG